MQLKSSGAVTHSKEPASVPVGSTDDPAPAFPSSMPYYTPLSLSISVNFVSPWPHPTSLYHNTYRKNCFAIHRTSV